MSKILEINEHVKINNDNLNSSYNEFDMEEVKYFFYFIIIQFNNLESEKKMNIYKINIRNSNVIKENLVESKDNISERINLFCKKEFYLKKFLTKTCDSEYSQKKIDDFLNNSRKINLKNYFASECFENEKIIIPDLNKEIKNYLSRDKFLSETKKNINGIQVNIYYLL